MDAAEHLHRQRLAAVNQWRDDDEPPLEIPMEAKPLSVESELRALQEAHQAIKSQLPFDYLDQFVGLPDWVQVVPTGSTKKGTQQPSTKDPIESAWNHPSGNQYKPLQLLKTNGYVRQNAIGAGVVTGQIGNGLILVDFDEPKDTTLAGFAEQTFEGTFEHSAADLPPAPQIESGKHGRYKVLLRVPEDWWSALANWSLSTGRYNDSQDALEVIWENGTGTGRHGTILGIHPQSTEAKPLIYRWRDGLSPADVTIPDAPVWLLAKCVELRARSFAPTQVVESTVGGGGDGEPKPFDLLLPKHQIQLIEEIFDEPYMPIRSESNTGNYDKLRRVVCGICNTWGLENGVALLEGTTWDKQNDYSYHGLGSLAKWAASLMKSATDEEKKARIGSVLEIAKLNGWKYPDWAKPPRDLDPDFVMKSAKDVVVLEKAWDSIMHMDSPTHRELAMKRLRSQLSLNTADFKTIVQSMLVEQRSAEEDFSTHSAVMAENTEVEPIIDKHVAAGVVSLYVAESGCGKSCLFYSMAEAVTTGGKFLDRFETKQTNVLIVQVDESRNNAKKKWKAMDYQPAEDRIHYFWQWSPTQVPELEKFIIENEIGLVLMDSFGKLFSGAGMSLNDAEIGLYLYSMNDMAARTGAGICITHHLNKGQGPRKDKEGRPLPVTKDMSYGSQFIVAGCSDIWGLWSSDSELVPEDRPHFRLRYLKDRSMLNDGGFTYPLVGDRMSLRFELEDFGDGGARDMDSRASMRQRLMAHLTSKSGDWFIVEELQNAVGGGAEKRHIQRELKDLFLQSAKTGIARRHAGGKGRTYEFSYQR